MKYMRGFTLIEILTAVLIITILVAMAMPLYEKTVERSRVAEARTVLAKLASAKQYTMDNMGCATFDPANPSCPQIKHLNIGYVSESTEYSSGTGFNTEHFYYSIAPIGALESVCAKRLRGDYQNTIFLYTLEPEDGKTPTFQCIGDKCSEYGMEPASLIVKCN